MKTKEAMLPMMEFDPECEVHRPVVLVKMVDPGCTAELQVEGCFTGMVTRLTTMENPQLDMEKFEQAVLVVFRREWAEMTRRHYGEPIE